MIVQEPVQAAIWHCLNYYDLKDAIFLAERLAAEVETDETIYILATCYYRSNLLHQAYWLLKEKSKRTPQCRFLLAKCAFQLRKFSEAENVLTYNGFADTNNFDDIVKDFGDIACFALQLIAKICLRTERSLLAAEAFRRALKLNPFMWDAFADLCQMGEEVDAASTFLINSVDVFSTCQGSVNTGNAMVLLGNNTNNTLQQQQLSQEPINSYQQINSEVGTNNTSGFILFTPLEQQQSPLSNTPNNNFNSSMALLRGTVSGMQYTGRNDSGITPLEQTPEQTATNATQKLDFSSSGTPYRRSFKYLSALPPTTPSFGLLPLSSPNTADTSLSAGNVTMVGNNANISNTNTPSPQMLGEVNQEQKVMGKKMRSQTSSLLRRESGTQNAANKPSALTQTGNITPRTPSNLTNSVTTVPNAAVRRSSRLFSNNSYSVKENNKSANIGGVNKFTQPRSPPRKTKSRITKICLNNELIDEKSSVISSEKLHEKHTKKEKDKEKIETITSATTVNNRTSISSEDSRVLINNNLNNAQTLAHNLLSLKKQSADGLMALLRDLGEGFRMLSQYECKPAITHLETTIPKHQLCTSWVQSLVGLGYYELREYEASTAIFKRIHDTDPFRLDYMEYYSSSMWHLQKDVDLSALAHDLLNQNKLSAVTWCVAGNCFSLHKEHETAIKFFKRAVQVDPEFVYSYTLLGHELVLTEELDKAMDYFRAAVVRDPRHYNAWYGIGTIYSKQEKYALAELHYIKALKINPQNSVLLVHIGAMQYLMQKKDLALQTLNTAVDLDPKNPLTRFHRGSINYSLGKHQEALRELEELKDVVPKESVVFYLIGKIHKALGNIDSALMHFSWATDLDPKGANNQIKDVFDSISHTSCCPATSEASLDPELEPISERSEDSTQAQQDFNYDLDTY